MELLNAQHIFIKQLSSSLPDFRSTECKILDYEVTSHSVIVCYRGSSNTIARIYLSPDNSYLSHEIVAKTTYNQPQYIHVIDDHIYLQIDENLYKIVDGHLRHVAFSTESFVIDKMLFVYYERRADMKIFISVVTNHYAPIPITIKTLKSSFITWHSYQSKFSDDSILWTHYTGDTIITDLDLNEQKPLTTLSNHAPIIIDQLNNVIVFQAEIKIYDRSFNLLSTVSSPKNPFYPRFIKDKQIIWTNEDTGDFYITDLPYRY